jgi:hypothetical protein
MLGWLLDQEIEEWRLYRAWGDLPPESAWWLRLLARLFPWWQWLLYIGITERTDERAAVARWAEHLKDKDWSPDIATWERDPRIWRSEAAVREAERRAIKREHPFHNDLHNRGNPNAVRVRVRPPRHVVRTWLRTWPMLAAWAAIAYGLWWYFG